PAAERLVDVLGLEDDLLGGVPDAVQRHVALGLLAAGHDEFRDPGVEPGRRVGGDVAALGLLVAVEAGAARQLGLYVARPQPTRKLVRLPLHAADMPLLVRVEQLGIGDHRALAEEGVEVGSAEQPRAEEAAEAVEPEGIAAEVAGAELDAVD